MNIGRIFGLTTLALTAVLVSACSASTQPIVGEGGDDVVESPPVKGGKLPPKPKTPGTTGGGDTPQTGGPTTNNPSNPGAPQGQPGPAGQPGDPGEPGDPGGVGEPGQPGRVSVNEHCCYGGKYFRCPNSAACFGGFDINACLSTCAGPQNPCFDACFDKLDAAGPPKGCQATAEPKGVDCANGSINISN